MENIVLDELKSLCDNVDKTENMYERGQILTSIDYLCYTLKDNAMINEMYEEVHKKASFLSFNFVGYILAKQAEIDEFMDTNNKFFDANVARCFKNHEYDLKKMVPLTKENVSYILETFLKRVDVNLFSFYQKMCSEGRIIYGPVNQTFFTTLDTSNTVISVNELRDLKDIMVFVHELGHAYYFYINNQRMIDRDTIGIEIKEEIPARILERKFVDFMFQNGVIEQAGILNDIFDHVGYSHDHSRETFDSIKYVIATDMACNVDEKENITKLFKHIYEADIFELIKENKNKRGKGKILK